MEDKIKILYAEDDLDFAHLTKSDLEDRGFEVELAGNGNEAWGMFLKSQPHLLLLDLDMPGRNGLELVDLVKHQNATFPIVIYSAHGDPVTVVKAIEMGVMDYCCKDTDFEIIVAKLRNIYKRCYDQCVNPVEYILTQHTLFNSRTGVLKIDDQIVKLTQMEASLLKLLSVKLNEWADADYLSEGMWNMSGRRDDLRRYATRLRKCLSADPGLQIENKWGGGYRLTNQSIKE